MVPGAAAAAAAAASRDDPATSSPNRPGQTASAVGSHHPSVSAATQSGSPDGPPGRSRSRELVAMKSLDLAKCIKDDSSSNSSSSGGGAEATQYVELQQQSRPFSLVSPRTSRPGQHLAEQVSDTECLIRDNLKESREALILQIPGNIVYARYQVPGTRYQ